MAQEREVRNDDNVMLETGDGEIARLTDSYIVVKAAMLAAFGRQVLAPVDLSRPGLKILDQATANGLWLREINADATALGATHSFLGTDIVDGYFANPPPNTRFQNQSMTHSWPVDLHSSFDLVHSRFSLAGAGTFPLTEVIANEAGLLKPGGWIQLEEMDIMGTIALGDANGPWTRKAWEIFKFVFDTLGVGSDIGGQLKGWVEGAGLIGVQERSIRLKYGLDSEFGLPKGVEGVKSVYSVDEVREVGRRSMTTTIHGLVGFAQGAGGQVPGLTAEEVYILPSKCEEEWQRQGATYIFKIVTGQKPS